jgi:hypothetical protein
MGNIDPIIENNFRYTLIENRTRPKEPKDSNFTFE